MCKYLHHVPLNMIKVHDRHRDWCQFDMYKFDTLGFYSGRVSPTSRFVKRDLFFCKPMVVKQCQLFLKPRRLHGTTDRVNLKTYGGPLCFARGASPVSSRHSATYTVNFAAEKLLKYESGSPTLGPWKMDTIHKLELIKTPNVTLKSYMTHWYW